MFVTETFVLRVYLTVAIPDEEKHEVQLQVL